MNQLDAAFAAANKRRVAEREAFYAPLMPLLTILRDSGLSPAQMAKELERRGVKTITGANRWQLGVVRRLLTRLE
jgi:hypothetical protein